MSFQQFLLILRARLKIILITIGVTVATTVAVSLVIPKQYTATASILVDTKAIDPITGTMLPSQMLPGYMATQVDIVKSPRVGQRVVLALKLDQNPELQADWKSETGGKVSLDVWMAERLARNLDVKPSRESSVISVSYTGAEPRFAAIMANAYAQSYIDTSLDLKVEPARQSANWFAERSAQLRENLEKAQAALSAYQRQHGIVAADERVDNEIARLNELSAQLSIAQAQTADSRSRQTNAGGGAIETMQEVIQNPLVQQLRAEVARQEAKLKEMSSQLGKNHPQFQRAEVELKTLQEKLDSESRRVAQGVGSTNRVNVQRESELRAAIQDQKSKVLDIRKRRDEFNVLAKDVEAAQKAYDVVVQRLTHTSLESQASQTNIVVLTPATEPMDASRPKVVLNTLIAIFLGTLLGVGGALLLELLDRRVRSTDDLVEMLELPVLGVIRGDVQVAPSAGA